ncbi:MAG: mammalian cell entry protein, partial [Mycobacterium sp.]
GPPLINPNPNLADPNPPLPAWVTPSPPVPGSANPNGAPNPPAPPPASPPPTAPWVAPVAPKAPWIAPSSFGGNVGPVGSQLERNLLTVITGRPATAATELLLGPVARGTTVSLTHSPSAGMTK